MDVVLTVFAVLFGSGCIGFIAGCCYEHGTMKRQLHEAEDAGYRQGLQRGRNECRAMQDGATNYRSLTRARVKLHDERRSA